MREDTSALVITPFWCCRTAGDNHVAFPPARASRLRGIAQPRAFARHHIRQNYCWEVGINGHQNVWFWISCPSLAINGLLLTFMCINNGISAFWKTKTTFLFSQCIFFFPSVKIVGENWWVFRSKYPTPIINCGNYWNLWNLSNNICWYEKSQ